MNLDKTVAAIIVIWIFACFSAVAQQVIIVDQSSGDPIENVALFNQDRTISTLSDKFGKADIHEFANSDSIYLQHPSFEAVGFNRHELVYGANRITLKKRTIMMEEFVISALKDRERRSETPYMIDLLGPEILASSNFQTGADILLETGNVMVQKSQGGGGSPIIRGFEANKILLVVDGVRMNNAIYRSGHLQNAITIDPNILERVEILYGPSSTIYGSDALGGVIHYYTRNPVLDTLKTEAYMQFSTANRGKIVHANLNMGSSRVANITSITISDYGDIRSGRSRKDEYGTWGLLEHYVGQVGGMDSTLVNPKTHIQKNTGYTQYDIFSKTSYSPSNKIELSLNLQLSTSSEIDRFDQLNDYDDVNLKYSEWYYGPQTRFLASVQGVNKMDNRLFTNMTTTLAFQKIDEDRISRKFRENEKLSQEEDVLVSSANFDFFKLMEKGQRLYYGFDYTHNSVRSSASYEEINTGDLREAMSRYPGGGNHTQSMSVYGNYKQGIGENSIFNAGLRYQYGLLRSEFNDQNLPIENISINNGALTGSLSLIYNPDNSWQYNLILATGFRNPNIDDYGKVRAKGDFITVPNQDLGSEYSYNAEISTRKTVPGYFTFSGSFFFTYLTNAIVRTEHTLNGADSLLYDGDYYKIITNSNASLATINGVSLNVKSELEGNLSFLGSLNFLKGKDITNDCPLGHIPPIYGRVSMKYVIRKFTGGGSFVYSGRKYWQDLSPFGEDNEDEALNGEGYPRWYTINLRSKYILSDHIELQLAINNLLDRFYKTFASGVASPGRNFIFTLRANI
jgi:hemoglobin/transferrin/lactoferrin receptor protein